MCGWIRANFVTAEELNQIEQSTQDVGWVCLDPVEQSAQDVGWVCLDPVEQSAQDVG